MRGINLYNATGIGWHIVAISPAIIFFIAVAHYTPNIPYADDYDAILASLIRINKITQWRDFVSAITAQHNEHRVAVCRILAFLDYKLFGELNFTRLALYGDLSLLGIALVMIKAAGLQQRPIAWLPVFLIIFELRHYESAFWAMTSLSNYTVIFFAFLAAYLLEQEQRIYFLMACLSAIISTFSQGNGLFIFPIGFVSLICQRRYQHSWIWLSIFAIVAYSYFINYHRPSIHADPAENIRHLSKIIQFFLLFIGSAAHKTSNALTLGIIIFATTVTLIFNKLPTRNRALFSMLAFIIITASSAAVVRAGFGALAATVSRYSINSVIILSLLYLSIINIARNKSYIAISASVFACIFLVQTYKHDLPQQIDRYERLEGVRKCDDSGYRGLFSPPSERHAEKILHKAEEMGLYHLPSSSDRSGCATIDPTAIEGGIPFQNAMDSPIVPR